MRIETMISEVQAVLGVDVDGRAGPQTWGAIYAELVEQPPLDGRASVDPDIDAVDERSESNIATLLPHVRPLARALVHKAASIGITIKVISGTRTYSEQNTLYAQGRTQLGPVVTNARGGYSNHNFGIAFDIGVFDGKAYLTGGPGYAAVGALGMDLGLEWGGSWKNLVDQPHFQLRPPWAQGLSEYDMLVQLRDRVNQNATAFG